MVDRIRAGEHDLFEILMRRYNQRLYRVARSFVDDAEAEDVVQEAYVRAFENLDQFAGRSSFATWLSKIALYEAMARSRKRRRFTTLDGEQEDKTPAAALLASRLVDPETQASGAELQRILAEAVDELPDSRRIVFMLREVEGLSTSQTAECLGISSDNVKVRLHRARSQLRARIDHQLGAQTQHLFSFGFARCDRMVARVLTRLRSRRPSCNRWQPRDSVNPTDEKLFARSNGHGRTER